MSLHATEAAARAAIGGHVAACAVRLASAEEAGATPAEEVVIAPAEEVGAATAAEELAPAEEVVIAATEEVGVGVLDGDGVHLGGFLSLPWVESWGDE